MKRVIVEYAKLTKDILDMLIDKYPDGYDYSDVISFKNAKGETVKAIEVKTEDTIYLVKISDRLENAIEEYAEYEEFIDDIDDININDIEDEN